jgi:superfamily II DNA or RNA helicase
MKPGPHIPRLDTLIVSMPLSFKGQLIQYAGRLNRVHEPKRDPLIFDHLDGKHALTNAMFRRRLAGYKELGYQVEMPQDAAPVWFEAMAGDAE